MVCMEISEVEACHLPLIFWMACRFNSPLSSSSKNWTSVASPVESMRTLTDWPGRKGLVLLAAALLMLSLGMFKRANTSAKLSPACTVSSVQ